MVGLCEFRLPKWIHAFAFQIGHHSRKLCLFSNKSDDSTMDTLGHGKQKEIEKV